MEKKNGDEQLDSIRFEREREVENRPESLLVERVQLFFFFLSLSFFLPHDESTRIPRFCLEFRLRGCTASISINSI